MVSSSQSFLNYCFFIILGTRSLHRAATNAIMVELTAQHPPTSQTRAAAEWAEPLPEYHATVATYATQKERHFCSLGLSLKLRNTQINSHTEHTTLRI